MDATSHELLDILARQSIRKGDFVLASGARSHYYCDVRATALSPRGGRLCGESLVALLRPFEIEAVGGMAMGAAYLASVVALASEPTDRPLSAFVVRPATKDHGMASRIDAAWHPDGPLIRPGRRVAVIDDVVTSAGSILRALDAVEEAGCAVQAVAAVLDRQAGGAEKIRARGYPFAALFVADENGDLSPGGGF
ncbi:MAG TPA: phosphoribosyltransferase family protein [Thermoanaerobaculia bacterium]|nr:phosphoribosyltransferase family protein [Thermoanaerobaculia bacterium]